MNWNVASFVCSVQLSFTPTGWSFEVCKDKAPKIQRFFELKLMSLHKEVSQRPSASPSPAKGRYWTLFIQDKEPAGPCRLQGCHIEVFS